MSGVLTRRGALRGAVLAAPALLLAGRGSARAQAGVTLRAAQYKAGDKAGVAAQWAVLRGTCTACHDTYRQPDKPRG